MHAHLFFQTHAARVIFYFVVKVLLFYFLWVMYCSVLLRVHVHLFDLVVYDVFYGIVSAWDGAVRLFFFMDRRTLLSSSCVCLLDDVIAVR